jgi:hypothetical protein
MNVDIGFALRSHSRRSPQLPGVARALGRRDAEVPCVQIAVGCGVGLSVDCPWNREARRRRTRLFKCRICG